MYRLHKCLFVMLMSLAVLCISTGSEAAVAVFVSSAPPVREEVPPPYGYDGCYMVPGGYYNNFWINPHRVCEYPDAPDGGAWIAGYWQCTSYSYDHCRHWGWVPSHWVRPGYRGEYGVQWRGGWGHRHHDYDRRYEHRYDHGDDHGYRHDDWHGDHREYKDAWH